jgi:hypothetical protein
LPDASEIARTRAAADRKRGGARSRLAALTKLAYEFGRDPIEGALNLHARIAERSEHRMPNGFMPWPPCPYQEDDDWDERLHALLGLPWPCDCTDAFFTLWQSVTTDLARRNLNLGRGKFGGWGDGEPGLVRATWMVVIHRRPAVVIETGVARGLTTRFVLEAMERNGTGHLWSIDLPPPRARELHDQVGVAVPPELRAHWSYVRGSTRRRLPRLLDELHGIDLFIHDSRHSSRNLLFELRSAWSELRPGGVLIADDIDLNCGFHTFRAEHRDANSLNCLAEPLEPDVGRHRDRGLFAIVLK